MFSETLNYLTIILLISYLIYFQRLNVSLGLTLAGLSILPIFLVGAVVPMTLVSDSIQYTIFAQIYRAELFGLGSMPSAEDIGTMSRHEGGTVDLIGFIYALIPIPIIDNYKSIGFSNKFLFILMISFIYSHKIRRDNFLIIILIFYPSIIFYSSVGLKDTLVLISMVFLAYYIIEKKILPIILTLYILYLLRNVNAFLFIPIISAYMIIFSKYKLPLKSLMILSASVFLLFFLYLKSDSLIELLNNYRLVRGKEDGLINLILFKNIYDLIVNIFYLSYRFFFLPNLLTSTSLFEAVNSVENIIISILLFYLFFKLFLFSKTKCLFWLLCLIFIAGIYGYVQSNVGSLVRYKFVFIAMYFTILTYEIKYNRLKND